MAKVLIDESTLTDIADSIRSKKGTTALINPANYASEISGISGGGGSSVPNSYTVNLYDENDVLTASYNLPCGTALNMPLSAKTNKWVSMDSEDVYTFPINSDVAGTVLNLKPSSDKTLTDFVYENYDISKNEYPYFVLIYDWSNLYNEPYVVMFYNEITLENLTDSADYVKINFGNVAFGTSVGSANVEFQCKDAKAICEEIFSNISTLQKHSGGYEKYKTYAHQSVFLTNKPDIYDERYLYHVINLNVVDESV